MIDTRKRIARRSFFGRLGNAARKGRRHTPLSLEALEPRMVLNGSAVWDDVDSHKWIGEEWGTDPITLDWVEFDGRQVVRADVMASTHRAGLMRTDGFPAEDWTGMRELRADIYQVGGTATVDAKLEVRGRDIGNIIESIVPRDLVPNSWNTVTWPLDTIQQGYDEVSHVSIVFEHLNFNPSTFYVDNLRLVTTGGETQEWDNMDDDSRYWSYGGDWSNWYGQIYGLEPVSHNGGNPTTPAGSLYLEWDYVADPESDPTSAEIGTSEIDDVQNRHLYTHITADVKISDADVPINVFFWDRETETGFGTPGKSVRSADTWQAMEWDVPWPPYLEPAAVDEIKFVANGIDPNEAGTLFIDNIDLITKGFPLPVSGLDYGFESFDRESIPSRRHEATEFSTNWGDLIEDYVTARVLYPNVEKGETAAEESRGAYQIRYALPENTLTGIWMSLWGHSTRKETKSLDFTDIFSPLNDEAKDFEQIQFWVRGSGLTDRHHNVKVELKDADDSNDKMAYRYITIDDSDTTWRKIVLDADVTNSDFWSYNMDPPDPTRMKFLNFVVESFFNDPFGTFYIDNIKFVDADDTPFDPAQETDDAFLDLVSQRAFQYFIDWYEPNTGLSHDRSEFPDLMSIAATGFGLTALTIGEERGWITREDAVDMVTQTLVTLRDGQRPLAPGEEPTEEVVDGMNGYRGFFFHFLNEDGVRSDHGSELSSVDTALVIIGALTAKEHFSEESVIVELVDEIVERVEWDWMLNPATNRVYHAWNPVEKDGFEVPDPDGGYFSNYEWDYTTDETMLINILAMASPTHSLPDDVFYAWDRVTRRYDYEEGGTKKSVEVVTSYNGSYFTYFFAHLWIDFRSLGKDQPPPDLPEEVIAVDWWENSVQATLANRLYTMHHADDRPCDADDAYTTYGVFDPESKEFTHFNWGLTAADGPDGAYHAYGAGPAAALPHHDGTIAPYGAGSGIIFDPDASLDALKHYYTNTELWNERLGFGDAYNLDPPDCNGPWYNRATFGIDNGPLLMAIENHRSGFVWDTIRKSDEITEVLSRLFGHDKIGVHRNRNFLVDANGNGQWDRIAGGDMVYAFGGPDDTPVIGDWNGDGFDEIGVYRPSNSKWYLDVNGNGRWDAPNPTNPLDPGDAVYQFGIAEVDTPIVGDWDGDGIDNIGVHRNDRFLLDANGNGRWEGPNRGDLWYKMGGLGDDPLIGDWNSDGKDEIGVHRNQNFFLDANADGRWSGTGDGLDVLHSFRDVGEIPVAGDWNGDGTDEIGTRLDALFFFDFNGNGTWDRQAGGDVVHNFGGFHTDTPIVGDWAPRGEQLLAAPGARQTVAPDAPPPVELLTPDMLAPVVDDAVDIWSAAPLSATQQRALDQVDVRIANLPGPILGQASGSTITIDVNAAGWGWFVEKGEGQSSKGEGRNEIPHSDFRIPHSSGSPLSALDSRLEMDLLTAVMHELGHAIGLDDDYSDPDSDDLMNGWLATGEKRSLTDSQLDLLFQDMVWLADPRS